MGGLKKRKGSRSDFKFSLHIKSEVTENTQVSKCTQKRMGERRDVPLRKKITKAI